MNDISRRASFEIIRYANCWEDADILVKGLDPGPGMRCLSIASGGDNSLALLARDPELVVAADFSGAQIACTELKRAAVARLDHDRFLRFLGFRESLDGRLETYRELRAELSAETRGFWDARLEILRAGIIHGGKFERYFQLFRKRVLPLIHKRRDVHDLLLEKDRPAREEFYRHRWNTWRWRLVFRIFFSRFVMGRMGRDPEFFRYVQGNVAARILRRVEHALTALSTHDNPFMTYILTGNFGDALPFYARPENFGAIKQNVERLVLAQGSAGNAASRIGGKFHACNLSDIFEYMNAQEFRARAEELLRICAPGARLAYWNMLVPRRISEILPDRAGYLGELSGDLFMHDRAFFYQAFHVDRYIG